MKTNEEIAAEIRALIVVKPKVPWHGMAGNNWKMIEAQVFVLANRLDEDGVWDRYDKEGWTDETRCEAMDALWWMIEESPDKPSDSWQELADAVASW